MEDLCIHYVNLEQSENLERHHTVGFHGAKTLVVRRGAPFRISLELKGRPFNPTMDALRIKVSLGSLSVMMPVTFSKKISTSSGWDACICPESLNSLKPSILISSPASASVGSYSFQLYVLTQDRQKNYASGNFILLFNPWCREDNVYLPSEEQRREYVQSDSGLLFMGTSMNVESRPWSLDQYEQGVLEACMSLLQISPQHQKNIRTDYLNRNNPVYISRVVSAMINCEDDRGVLKGNWSGDFKQGVHPTSWTGSGDILRQWAQSGFQPVKYGQCWVFAAVMCTVMRVLGIPCRVVTNFNSAHDTNDNLVIEEYYSETGKKLNLCQDSIWNFHVWVECWMTRQDLGPEMNGWQVLDPTPQERSGGVFCCGPAPVKAIKSQRIDLLYDVPFVFAEVNADVHTIILSQGQVVSFSKDKERVGSLICTKAVGLPTLQDITAQYKSEKSSTSSMSSRTSNISKDTTIRRAVSSESLSVFLVLEKSPAAGEPIRFTVKMMNKQNIPKMIKVHVDAQAKEYNRGPLDTFWEKQGVIQLAPMEVKKLQYQISPAQYQEVVGDNLINLAVVLEDMATHERVLTSEEFNILTPHLTIQVPDEDLIVAYKQHAAIVSFTNTFQHPVSGLLTVTGAGLMNKIHFRMDSLLPGGRVEQRVAFVPRMVGTKMLQASLSLSEINVTVRGFKLVQVSSI